MCKKLCQLCFVLFCFSFFFCLEHFRSASVVVEIRREERINTSIDYTMYWTDCNPINLLRETEFRFFPSFLIGILVLLRVCMSRFSVPWNGFNRERRLTSMTKSSSLTVTSREEICFALIIIMFCFYRTNDQREAEGDFFDGFFRHFANLLLSRLRQTEGKKKIRKDFNRLFLLSKT